ncbi:MAG: molybdenum transporter substrate-binding protein [Bacilli bacterium]|nr:molybdenum transporter substrate-binding protein [Bacilli bacterium]
MLTKKIYLISGFLVISLLVLAACGMKKEPIKQVELTISAASSLTDSLKEIQTLFTGINSKVKLNFNFGASGTLQQQIEQGAPVDVFISAGKKQMQALIDKQLVEVTQQKNLLTNELVLVTPIDDKRSVNKVEDLAKPEVNNIAVGQPDSVPAGSYAKEALTYYKLWDALQSKIILAKDVRQVLTYVETGNSDAGFVYKTDALTSKKVKVDVTIDPKSYPPIQYPMGLIKASKHFKESQVFFDYLQSKAAQDIFLKYGFSLPKLS